ncbi:dihydrolipoamide acetyltransferase family protein [Anaerotignum propionicum]|jgi:pyruvate dehydrogenase E2 component (dihydrolipoamide acetyltransferase)|uniref:Dihydrolipoamide acetyltransferase component of pyruvate dehydrogenase complex n=1 Tax=Anaerotignum propionicum DSM 1682 TaxID=991789 RepID=A0A0X8VDT3_ANAPI|nr:dihydrolipoamide acetyltransferase family protein [Anaerotignum propionicum]AMJ41905.1 dihydrolipoyllysine-residue acetyltransferase component of pyruvate dehydrogenase complex [Anaerotignum propionicum DSM 1682]SHE95291.1 pyruvate dehydrogenase E2 component (dihydrolipoamide acetyltransferase) [[Clostridium] propionicum DSM 1682] [Anaerotignum propionicum DSM 1682]HBF66130.1 2-oxo acid dehydrogenase subunit E2 [Clostridium sp.]
MAFEVKMPQLGLTMEEGTVTRWVKKEGEAVKAGDVIVEITTDKLTSEVESEFDGTMLKIVAQEGEDIPVKGLLAYIGEPGETVGSAEAAPATAPVVEVAPVVAAPLAAVAVTATGRVRISPLARKTATKMGIDYTNVKGSGPAGRIVQKDILTAAQSAPVVATVATQAAASTPAPVIASGSIDLMEGDEVVKLAGMRKVVAERMAQSRREIPSVTQNVKIDVTNLMKFRKQVNEDLGVKYSVNDFILKAVAKALKNNKHILVTLDGDKIIKRAHVNVGMAVALDEGLIVPVLKDIDKMSLEEISATAKDLAERARTNKLGMDEYKGSTFSISNLGMFGVETFDPIVNQPDSGILGVCAVQDELVMDDEGNISKRQFMRISFTFDHRLIDGATAAKFELAIKELLENPMKILL